MKFAKKDINISPLTYTMVLVWKQPLSSLPSFSDEFLKSLFSNPSATSNNITPQGITVSENFAPKMIGNVLVPPINHILHFGFERFTLRHTDLNKMCQVYKLFYEQLIKIVPSIQAAFIGNLGINCEFEVSINGFKYDKIIQKMLNLPEPNSNFSRITSGDIKLQISENVQGKLINLSIQPRVFSDNLVFFLVNDHFGDNGNRSLFTPDTLSTTFSTSINKFENLVLPFIFKY